MKFFRKDIVQPKPAASDKAARWIAGAILKVQRKFANVLVKVSASWQTKQQWIFLVSVCVVFGGLSIVALIKAFKKQNYLSKPTAIKVPRQIPKESYIRITEDEFRQVQKFKRSLDGASKLKLMEERPGLMDSLDKVEQIYYSQTK